MIDVQITPEGLKDVQYVVITMKLKDANIETKGLLVGYRAIVDRDMDLATLNDKFIWLFREGCIHMFSTNYYDIDALDIQVKQNNELVSTKKSFPLTVAGQVDAKKMISDVVKAFDENKFSEFNGLVKHTKYTLPENLKHLLEDKTSSATTTVHKPQNNWEARKTGTAGYNTGHTPYQHNTTTGWQRKEVSTANMKRTTRYDVIKALTAMAEKIERIREGSYQPSKLPKIPADKMPENGEGDVDSTENFYDDYAGYGY